LTKSFLKSKQKKGVSTHELFDGRFLQVRSRQPKKVPGKKFGKSLFTPKRFSRRPKVK